MNRFAALGFLFAAMTLTGANVPLGKLLIAQFPLALFLLFRFAVCTLALATIVHSEPGPKLRDMSPHQIRDVVLMSLLGMLAYTVFILEGLRRTSAVDAGIITATIPAAVALLGVAILGERLTRRRVATIALAVLGIAIIQTAGAAAGGRTAFGNALVGAAVFCEASFVIFGKRLAPPYRPVRLSLAANLAGLIMALPLGLHDLMSVDIAAIPGPVWMLATWYSLAAGVICLLLWYNALPHVETSLAGLATSAIPVTALAISAYFLGESVGPAKLAGAALVILAIVLAATARPLKRDTPQA